MPTLRNATCKVDKLNSDINWVGMVDACVQGTSYFIRYFLLLLFIKTKDIRTKEFLFQME